MITLCCDAKRDSKFCPECGRPLAGDHGNELLRHCEVQAAKAKRSVEERIKDGSDQGRIQKATGSLAKWNGRIEWIKKAIQATTDLALTSGGK